MTDREDFHLRGRVRTVRNEYASIDPQVDDWGPFTHGAIDGSADAAGQR